MKKILSIICMVFMVFTIAACGSNHNEGNNDEFYNSFDNAYSYSGTSSFAKLRIVSVDNNVYSFWPFADWRQYILIECAVEEDYYGRLETNTVINIQLALTKTQTTHYSESEIRDMFTKDEYILTYVKNLRNQEFTNLSTNEYSSFSNVAEILSLSFLQIIPIKDNKVELTPLYLWLDDQQEYYDTHSLEGYIAEGMAIEEVAEKIESYVVSQQ